MSVIEVTDTADVVDLFAGPGGWDEGMKWLGITDVLGIEWDKDACATAVAAGHRRLQADVARVATAALVRKMVGLIGSPPCTKFSPAGNGSGRSFLPLLADGIRDMFRGVDRRAEIREAMIPALLAEQVARNESRPEEKRWTAERMELAAHAEADVIVLVLEPARFTADALNGGGPLEWVLLEQVKEVLPLWHVYKRCLVAQGWSVWTGVLSAADQGVPQTRERAILIARRSGLACPPAPTHAQRPEPSLFGDDLLPWVSMAEALGWADGHGRVEYRSTTMPNSAVRRVCEPAPTIAFGHDAASARWILTDGSALRVTVDEAAALQSFPVGYPWRGSQTSQFLQVGNAVPPRLAAAVAATVVGAQTLAVAA